MRGPEDGASDAAPDACSADFADQTSLYVTAGGPLNASVVKTQLIQGPTIELVNEKGTNYAVALRGGFTYFANGDAGEINRVPIAGGTLEKLVTGQSSASSLAFDDDYVYWTNYGTNDVMRGPVDGGDTYVVASSQAGASDVVVDSKAIYWTCSAGNSVMMIAK